MRNKPVHLVYKTVAGKTTFTEQAVDGEFRRGRLPVTYIYIHATGNMRMKHPSLYATREIMARSLSGQAAGAKPAKPNDIDHALKVASEHLRNYKPRS